MSIGLVVFLIVGLVPPWRATRRNNSRVLVTNPVGHFFLFDPPSGAGAGRSLTSHSVDTERLAIYWVLVVVLTGGLVLLVSGPASAGKSAPGARGAPWLRFSGHLAFGVGFVLSWPLFFTKASRLYATEAAFWEAVIQAAFVGVAALPLAWLLRWVLR